MGSTELVKTGRTVIKAHIAIAFYEREIYTNVLYTIAGHIIRFLLKPGSIEHVGLIVATEVELPRIHNTCWIHASKWITVRSAHKRRKPSNIVLLGTVEDLDYSIVDDHKSVGFCLSATYLYKLTRKFCKWKPKRNCTMETIKMARELGFEFNDHVFPIDLLKEIQDANDYDCWES